MNPRTHDLSITLLIFMNRGSDMKSTIRVSKPPSCTGFGLNSHQSDSKGRALGHQALLTLCEASPPRLGQRLRDLVFRGGSSEDRSQV